MGFRILLEAFQVSHGLLNLRFRHFLFFCEAVRQQYHPLARISIEYPIVDIAPPNSEFMNPLLQNITVGPPQIMPLLGQKLNSDGTLVVDFGRQAIQPIQ